MTTPLPVTLWLHPAQEDLARAVVDRLNLHPVGVGSPALGQGTRLAERFGARALDDLRGAISAAQSGLVLILAAGDFGADAAQAPLEEELLRIAPERGVRVASLEPVPVSLVQLTASRPDVGAGIAHNPDVPESPDRLAARLTPWVSVLPLTRLTRPVAEMIEGLSEHPARSLSITSLGSPAEGTLGARLFDAMDLALGVLGEPEAIDAGYTASDVGRSLHPLPGESLSNLHGDLSANLRYAGGRTASVFCSSAAGACELSVTAVWAGGSVRVDARGVRWAGSHEKPPAPAPSFLDNLCAQLDLVARGAPTSAGTDALRVLAMAQAALLSARTGEPESPATMIKMAGL